MSPREKKEKQTTIFGHRGASGSSPENTMASFEQARIQGAKGIELDVQLTKDGVPVIIHDEKVDRTTDGSGWVKDYTFTQLRTLDAGSKFHQAYRGEKVPSLEEVLSWGKEYNVQINIELKTGIIPYEGIERHVIDLVYRYQMHHQVILSSFNHYSLVEARKLDQEIETAILIMEGLYEPWHYAQTVGANSIHCHLPVAVPNLIQGARQAKTPLRTFTVNDEQQMKTLMEAGIDGIFTDWPDKAIEIQHTLKKTC